MCVVDLNLEMIFTYVLHSDVRSWIYNTKYSKFTESADILVHGQEFEFLRGCLVFKRSVDQVLYIHIYIYIRIYIYIYTHTHTHIYIYISLICQQISPCALVCCSVAYILDINYVQSFRCFGQFNQHSVFKAFNIWVSKGAEV